MSQDKMMVLTGIGSEQDFKTGESKFLLVFNDGELRVPVTETAAEIIIKTMFSNQSNTPSVNQDEDDRTTPLEFEDPIEQESNDAFDSDDVDQV